MKKAIIGIVVLLLVILGGYYFANRYYTGYVELPPVTDEAGDVYSTSENGMGAVPREKLEYSETSPY